MIADGVDGSPVEYIFSYGIGSPNPLPTGSNPRCTSSSCQDVFRVTNSKVQQYLVSVAVRNVVGLGTANTLVRVGMLCKKKTYKAANITTQIQMLAKLYIKIVQSCN